MKKLFISLSIFIFPIIVLAYKPGDTYIKGDANNDGKVTSTDYIVVRKHILKQTTLVGDVLTRSDTTGDNKVTALDYIAIRKMILNGNIREEVIVSNQPTNTSEVTIDDTIYDVVLFWGQSNMVGYNRINDNDYDVYDSRLKKSNTCEKDDLNNFFNHDGPLCRSSFSILSGIKEDILNNYTKLGHVNVNIPDNTVYIYDYLNNNFEVITGKEESIGQNVYVKFNSNNSFKEYSSSGKIVAEKSSGTNMIPYFGKTYYEQTGHKLIVVFVAKGASRIERFLPEKLKNKKVSSDDKNKYLYELMIKEYNGAINYLKETGKKIGNKFHVSFQGEANLNYNDYYNLYMKVHNNLKKDLGLQFGVLIETSSYMPYDKNGNYTPRNRIETIKMYDVQKSIITNNSDIILGSDYAYRYYVPSKDLFCKKNSQISTCSTSKCSIMTESECNNKITDYEFKRAYKKGLLGRSLSLSKDKYDNNIHFNSAALSQIGYESAINAVKYIKGK